MRAWGDGGTGASGGSGIRIVGFTNLAPAGAKGASSGTTALYARVHNTGNEPVSNVLVRFYYGIPSLIASASDPSLTYIESAGQSYLAPGDTALIGPVSFADPGMNPYGQPYWKIFVTMEADGSPIETGWVESDFHVGVENYYKAESVTGEPMTLYFRIANPNSEPKRLYLSLARSTLPDGWQLECHPALGETLNIAGGAQITAGMIVRPDAIHGPIGTVTIEEELLDDSFPGCDAYCENDSVPTRVYVRLRLFSSFCSQSA
ncbi:MAG: hypothetical protein QME66_09025 [Candidatus Eisenbacteria bacterium]|nr:hypothetical protein [Candidatus Eisenbacteria bacterium]